jgi:hypothetical protein
MSRLLLIKKMHQRRMAGANRLDGYVEFTARSEETKAADPEGLQLKAYMPVASLADFEALARRIQKERE